MERRILAADSKKGLKNHARIGFSDESAFSDKPMVRKTWAPKGKTPILKVPGGWITRSVISLITCSPKGTRPRLYFETLRGSVNAPIFLGFLKGVKRHMGCRKLILVIDNLAGTQSESGKRIPQEAKGLPHCRVSSSLRSRTQSDGVCVVEQETQRVWERRHRRFPLS